MATFTYDCLAQLNRVVLCLKGELFVMARVKLRLPHSFPFTTEVRVRVTDVNYGGHLGNDRILSFVHEARVRYLTSLGFSELDIGGGVGTIMVDAVLIYKSESFQGDIIRIDVAMGGFHKFGCDVFYKLTNITTEREVARAKTGLAFFDYDQRKLTTAPQAFLDKYGGSDSLKE
jgi:acyl-CoA thioester hydrolase